MRAMLALATALFAAPALAASCDALSEPLAYNACLARQGPAAHAVAGGPAPRRAEGRQRTGGRLFISRPHGRAELVFSPGK